MDDSLTAPAMSSRKAISIALGLLSLRDRRRYKFVVAAQMATSVLDLIGVLLLGIVGLLGASAIQGTEVPVVLDPLLERLGLADVSAVALAGICCAVAAGFLLAKSVVSAVLMRKVFRFLGARQGDISSRLAERLMSQPLLAIEQRSSQETVYALSTGVYILVTSMLGSVALLLSEITLLLILFVTLAFIDPLVTLAAGLYFAAVAFGIHRGLSAWASHVGSTIATSSVQGTQRLQEAMVAYREITVLGRRAEYSASISRLWRMSGKASGESLFLMQLPKIAYETALVIGGVGLVAWQFAVSGPAQAVATVVLFLAAGSRVLPSLLRINTLNLTIRGGIGSASLLYPIIAELEQLPDPPLAKLPDYAPVMSGYPGFTPDIELREVTVQYPGASAPALNCVSVRVKAGQRIAVVGSTGAGKSTLADVLLGVIQPKTGEILISGLSPEEVIERWPGAIAYVPQHVAMINGTVRENVALGVNPESCDDAQVWRSLNQARLATFLSDQRDGIDTVTGERGVRLSGGQRQRLGLARALYSAPQLLVLDEATSALDAETESQIADALNDLSRDVTTITIAHRLATIRDADQVVFLEEGTIRDIGTFDELRRRNPQFERQALLSGIELGSESSVAPEA